MNAYKATSSAIISNDFISNNMAGEHNGTHIT